LTVVYRFAMEPDHAETLGQAIIQTVATYREKGLG
jgi:hypothetical protein